MCEILTGKPPYVGEDGTQIHRQASRGQLGDCFDRLANCEADTDLIALTKDCLELEPGDRPHDAGVLSARVTHYLESVETKLRETEMQRAVQAAQAAEERKRRRVVVALAASVLLMFVIVGSGWLWLRQQREQLATQIQNEVATAQALRGDPAAGAFPDEESLIRAHEAAERAHDLLDTGAVSDGLEREVSDLLVAMNNQVRDQKLIADLEDAWAWEMEQLAEGSEQEVIEAIVVDEKTPNGATRRGLPIVQRALPLYEEAFAAWGIDPNSTSATKAVHQILQLPEQLQPPVVAALDRWLQLSRGPHSLEQWKSADWTVLEVVEFSASSGATHEVLPDGSILVASQLGDTGDQYELVVQTDRRDVSGIRLEALPHESLPSGGPGRRRGSGGFDVHDFRVASADSAGRTPLPLRSAVSDYISESPRITLQKWSIFFGRSEAYEAFFEIVNAHRRQSGLKLVISMESGLGRFRLSACGMQAHTDLDDWLETVIAGADRDDWRNSLRAEVARADVRALLARAADSKSLEQQPKIVKMWLAEALRRMDEGWMLANLPDVVDWNVVEPTSLKSSAGAALQLEQDGSVFVSGENALRDTYTITLPVGNRPVAAIRLEMLPDSRLPRGAGGRGENGVCRIDEFEVSTRTAADAEPNNSVAIEQVFSDHGSQIGVSKVIDGVRFSAWTPKIVEPRAVVFVLKPRHSPRSSDALEVKLRMGDGLVDGFKPSPAGLGRFRLSVTDDITGLREPRDASLALLGRLHELDPSDYWVNVALAQTLAARGTTDLQAALRHAAAAIALRPNNPMAHATLVRSVPIGELAVPGPLRELAFHHANRACELDPGNIAVHRVAHRFFSAGWATYCAQDYDAAAELYRTAIGLEPDYGRAFFVLGHVRLKQEKLDEALAAYRSAFELNPNGRPGALHLIVSILTKQEKFSEAMDTLRRTVELTGPVDNIWWHAQSEIAGTFIKQRRFAEGISRFRLAVADIEDYPKRKAFAHDNVVWHLVRNPQTPHRFVGEAVKMAELARALAPDSGYRWHTLGVVYYRSGQLPTALNALQKSVDLGADHPGNWLFLAMSHQRLGNGDQARIWYDKALEWRKDYTPDETLQGFYNEAELLLETSETSGPNAAESP